MRFENYRSEILKLFLVGHFQNFIDLEPRPRVHEGHVSLMQLVTIITFRKNQSIEVRIKSKDFGEEFWSSFVQQNKIDQPSVIF